VLECGVIVVQYLVYDMAFTYLVDVVKAVCVALVSLYIYLCRGPRDLVPLVPCSGVLGSA
jgi:hypothetical protein